MKQYTVAPFLKGSRSPLVGSVRDLQNRVQKKSVRAVYLLIHRRGLVRPNLWMWFWRRGEDTDRVCVVPV